MSLPLWIWVCAALAYLCAGWRHATGWLGMVAAASATISAVTTSDKPGIAVGVAATVALAGAPARLADDLADHRYGAQYARAFGFTCCSAMAATQATLHSHAPAGLSVAFVLLLALPAIRRHRRSRRAGWHAAVVFCVGGGLLSLAPMLPPSAMTWMNATGFALLTGLTPWFASWTAALPAPAAGLVNGALFPAAWWWSRQTPGWESTAVIAAIAGLILAICVACIVRRFPTLLATITTVHIALATLAVTHGAEASSVWILLTGHALLAAVGALLGGALASQTGSHGMEYARGLAVRAPALAAGIASMLLALLVLPAATVLPSLLWQEPMGSIAYGVWLAAVTVRLGQLLLARPRDFLAHGAPRRLHSTGWVVATALAGCFTGLTVWVIG